MFKAKRIEHAKDGREITEEELADWLSRDQSLLYKLREDGVLLVCEATPSYETSNMELEK